MQLSKNYTLQDFTKSNDATRLGIDNIPSKEQVDNLILLCTNVLEPLCTHFGFKVPISSGFRSIVLNKQVGGSITSDHCKGMAADLDLDMIVTKVTNLELFNYIKDTLQFKQLILEFPNANGNPSWVHVSYDPIDLRKQVLVSYIENKKTKYRSYK